MERNLAMELVRVTEAAALASARLMGRGDEMAADIAAIEAMRKAFDAIAIDGTVVIGEGAEDAMPKLYVGEKVGTGQGPATDVALDALEGAAICAAGGYNALSVIAIAEHGTFLRVPDTYMDKIACGPEGRGAIDLDRRPRDNLKALADARGVYVEDLTVAILDRPRHNALLEEVRRAGARIKLITSGDVSAALATTRPDTGIDILMGVGGAPQGVLAAAFLLCVGHDGRRSSHGEALTDPQRPARCGPRSLCAGGWHLAGACRRQPAERQSHHHRDAGEPLVRQLLRRVGVRAQHAVPQRQGRGEKTCMPG